MHSPIDDYSGEFEIVFPMQDPQPDLQPDEAIKDKIFQQWYQRLQALRHSAAERRRSELLALENALFSELSGAVSTALTQQLTPSTFAQAAAGSALFNC